MNNDRVTELYEGTFGNQESQRLGRERIHWMCAQASGDEVLDVGCSQGIASILLGREGKSVVGIDHEQTAIDFATDRLEDEEPAVRRRVRFEYAEATRLPVDENTFDTVLMGELLEHLVQPAMPLTEAHRVLRPEGMLVITVPYGLSVSYSDHKEPLYLNDLLGLLEPRFEVQELALLSRYLGITAIPRSRPAGTSGDLWRQTALIAEQRLAAQEAALVEQRETTRLSREQAAKARAATTAVEEAARRASGERDNAVTQRDAVTQERDRALRERDAAEAARRTLEEARTRLEIDASAHRTTERELESEASAHRTTKRELAEARRVADEQTRRLAALKESRVYRVARLVWLTRRRLRQRRSLAILGVGVVLLVLALVVVATDTIPPAAGGLALAVVAIVAVSVVSWPHLSSLLGRRSAASVPALDAVKPSSATARRDGSRGDPAQELIEAAGAPTPLTTLRVASILDEISRQCFAPECTLVSIGTDWREQLDRHRPDLLLVESAWSGNSGSWQYMVGSYPHPSYQGLPQLRALVDWCRAHGTPTVFWNKEDPVHFDRFKEAAALFDHIFTTDADCISRYQELAGDTVRSIDALPFAAQPRLHNPIRIVDERSKAPCLAGTYYRNRHADRRKSLDALLDAARPYGLEIYDRRLQDAGEAYGFPDRFRDHIVGSLPYEQMVDVYKRHLVFLNANSVSESPTMFSRRVFELLACDTAVLSTQSVGIAHMFGDLVPRVDTEKEARAALHRLLNDDNYRRSITRRARRLVLREHTYRARLATIAQRAGMNVDLDAERAVSALLVIDDNTPAGAIDSVLADLRRQSRRPDELVVGVTEGAPPVAQGGVGDGVHPAIRTVAQASSQPRLGRWRQLAAVSSSPLVALLSPGWRYGEHHLGDLLDALEYTDADVIGTVPADDNGARPMSEHRFLRSVPPETALARRELIASRGWPDAAADGRAQLESWFRQGVRFYGADAGGAAPATPGTPGTPAERSAPRS